MNSWPKVKSGQVGVGSHIAQNHSFSLWEVIFAPNSHEKFTRGEIK